MRFHERLVEDEVDDARQQIDAIDANIEQLIRKRFEFLERELVEKALGVAQNDLFFRLKISIW